MCLKIEVFGLGKCNYANCEWQPDHYTQIIHDMHEKILCIKR